MPFVGPIPFLRLQSYVLDAVTDSNRLPEYVERRRPLLQQFYSYVRSQQRDPGRDRPDMQVTYVADARKRQQCLAHRLRPVSSGSRANPSRTTSQDGRNTPIGLPASRPAAMPSGTGSRNAPVPTPLTDMPALANANNGSIANVTGAARG
jgi:hypothetical protein